MLMQRSVSEHIKHLPTFCTSSCIFISIALLILSEIDANSSMFIAVVFGHVSSRNVIFGCVNLIFLLVFQQSSPRNNYKAIKES